jgi:hypothetical protein
MIFIGINISKLTFDAAYSLNSRTIHKQFSNSPKGFGAFSLWLKCSCVVAGTRYCSHLKALLKGGRH